MSGNAFERILGRLNESDAAVTEKTAAAAPATPSVEAVMLETVRRVSESGTKTAAAATAAPAAPVADLARMAKEAAATEEALLLKEAHTYGAALADGFMERFAQYDVALTNAGVKTASAPSEAAIKQAADAAYQRAISDMEKRAEAEYARGYQETMAKIHKTASEIHYAGQSMAHNLVERLAAEKR